MNNVVNLEEYKRQRAAEAMVVQCGPEKLRITWTPKLSEEDLERLRKAAKPFRDMIEQLKNS